MRSPRASATSLARALPIAIALALVACGGRHAPARPARPGITAVVRSVDPDADRIVLAPLSSDPEDARQDERQDAWIEARVDDGTAVVRRDGSQARLSDLRPGAVVQVLGQAPAGQPLEITRLAILGGGTPVAAPAAPVERTPRAAP